MSLPPTLADEVRRLVAAQIERDAVPRAHYLRLMGVLNRRARLRPDDRACLTLLVPAMHMLWAGTPVPAAELVQRAELGDCDAALALREALQPLLGMRAPAVAAGRLLGRLEGHAVDGLAVFVDAPTRPGRDAAQYYVSPV